MKRLFTLSLLLILVAGIAFADPIITPELQKKLQNKTNDKLPVIVLYQKNFSIKEIQESRNIRGDYKSRMTQVISILKKETEESQNLLSEFCDRKDIKNEVEGFKSFWISNMVAMKATPRVISQIAELPGIKSIVLDEEKVLLPEPPKDVPKDGRGGAWGIPHIYADQFAGCPSNIVVAVVDTGVDYNHSVFAPGQIDTKNDYDAYNNDDDAIDDQGHGTHCAGSIAGGYDGSERIGVAPGATILPIKVLSSSGSGSWKNVADGIQKVVEINATTKVHVISMSLGGGHTTDAVLRTAIENAIDSDIVVVIAAGNKSWSGDRKVFSPGSMKSVITVGAIDSTGTLASFSCIGPSDEDQPNSKPDVVAPGVNVKSAKMGGGFTEMSGTSMATPHVAGVAALVLANNTFPEGQVNEKVKERIKTYVINGSTAQENWYGNGTVCVPGAVKAVNYPTDGLTFKLEPVGEVRSSDTALSYTLTKQSREIDIGQIINIAKQVWEFIAANKPVVNTQWDFASAVPQGTSEWSQLAGWQSPNSRDYRLTAKNLYGITVLDFTYRIMWTWGGNYQGKGKFLTNVTAVPVNLEVAWGYTFDCKVQVPQVYNVGTSDNPTAAMQMIVSWVLKTIVKHSEGAGTYEVRGNGEFREIGK